MKKIIYTLGISFLLINCSQEMVDTSNTNGVEGINLEELNIQKANYTQQINDLKLELEKIVLSFAAKKYLNWMPKTNFKQLVHKMVDFDINNFD